jgi:hypothetical protein
MPNGTSRSFAVEPGGDGVVERRSRRAQHQVGVFADAAERRGEGVDAVAGERPGIVAEGQVVHGHDERRRLPGRDEDRGGVDDVDRTGRPLDRWPAEAAPGLVERAAERERAHRHRRHEGCGRRAAVPRSDADEVHLGPFDHARPSRARRRPCRRHGVPALLQGVGHGTRPCWPTDRP